MMLGQKIYGAANNATSEGLRVPNVRLVLVSVGVILLSLAVYFVFASKLPPEIPLYYGRASGHEQLANQWMLVLPSLIAALILVVNVVISFVVKDAFLQKILVFSTLVATVFASISTVKIILLVGSL